MSLENILKELETIKNPKVLEEFFHQYSSSKLKQKDKYSNIANNIANNGRSNFVDVSNPAFKGFNGNNNPMKFSAPYELDTGDLPVTTILRNILLGSEQDKSQYANVFKKLTVDNARGYIPIVARDDETDTDEYTTGAARRFINTRRDGQVYALKEHQLGCTLSVSEMQAFESMYRDMFSLSRIAQDLISVKLEMERFKEIEYANYIQTSTIYGGQTNTPGTKWDAVAAGALKATFETAKNLYRTTTGLKPTSMWIGQTAFTKLAGHADLRTNILTTKPYDVDAEWLRLFIGLDEFYILDYSDESAGSITQLYGNNACMYNNPNLNRTEYERLNPNAETHYMLDIQQRGFPQVFNDSSPIEMRYDIRDWRIPAIVDNSKSRLGALLFIAPTTP